MLLRSTFVVCFCWMEVSFRRPAVAPIVSIANILEESKKLYEAWPCSSGSGDAFMPFWCGLQPIPFTLSLDCLTKLVKM